MDEQSKASRRRALDPRFKNRWFRGNGLDIGCGHDCLKPSEDFPLIESVDPYDQVLGNKDAQSLPEVASESYDFVHSSHCLEHLPNPKAALMQWLRVVRRGGFLIVTIPDEYLYERGIWPSQFNGDHKHSFSLRSIPVIPTSIPLIQLLWRLSPEADVELVQLLTDGWSLDRINEDQTLTGAECAIEFVLRRLGRSLV